MVTIRDRESVVKDAIDSKFKAMHKVTVTSRFNLSLTYGQVDCGGGYRWRQFLVQ